MFRIRKSPLSFSPNRFTYLHLLLAYVKNNLMGFIGAKNNLVDLHISSVTVFVNGIESEVFIYCTIIELSVYRSLAMAWWKRYNIGYET